jgi:hypothetical protein
MFDSSRFSALFLDWIRTLSFVVLIFGAVIPCSVSLLWLLTKFGSVQRWSLIQAISLLAAFLVPVLCLVYLLTFSTIRHLVTLIPNTGNFITDSPDGFHFANSVVVNANVALILNMTFFLFYNMFSGFSGLFMGAAVTLTCYFPEWSRKVDVCCRVRVVFRVLCFIVCPIVQIMICMHPLILWCQDSGQGVQLLWNFIYIWLLPVFFGAAVDQIVFSAAFEALSRSEKMLANTIPKKFESFVYSLKHVRHILNFVDALTIYCIFALVSFQAGFVYCMSLFSEDIISVNSNLILPDSGKFVRATMGCTFVICCAASQICFRILLLPQPNLGSQPDKNGPHAFNEQAEGKKNISKSGAALGSQQIHHNRSDSYSTISDATPIPSLHSKLKSPLDAARQRASSAASVSASAASAAKSGRADAAPEEESGINDASEYVFESFVQIGDNGNIYYREFSTDYSYFFFFRQLRDSMKEWIFESTEALYPEAFGWKVPFRRLSLLIGCIMVSLLLHKQVSEVGKFSAKAKIQSYLIDVGISLQWPSNGTVFDASFVAFNEADRKQVYCLIAAVSLFWLSFLSDVLSSCIFPANLANLEMLVAGGPTGYNILRHKSIMLFASRLCALFGGILVFGTIIVSHTCCILC